MEVSSGLTLLVLGSDVPMQKLAMHVSMEPSETASDEKVSLQGQKVLCLELI